MYIRRNRICKYPDITVWYKFADAKGMYILAFVLIVNYSESKCAIINLSAAFAS